MASADIARSPAGFGQSPMNVLSHDAPPIMARRISSKDVSVPQSSIRNVDAYKSTPSKSIPAQKTTRKDHHQPLPPTREAKTQVQTSSYDRNAAETARSFHLHDHSADGVFDLVCIGMGPASLAIAIALADRYAPRAREARDIPKVMFLEKQAKFGWHAGMQLPNAKMQISFMKDLATPRDPTSFFSFTNYLHQKGRLNTFINLDTFLPSRMEYEDYMRWCASHFENCTMYGSAVEQIEPLRLEGGKGLIDGFRVRWRNDKTGMTKDVLTRHVIIAAGGQPNIPEVLKSLASEQEPRVVHSSRYATTVQEWEEMGALQAQPKTPIEDHLSTEGVEADLRRQIAQLKSQLSAREGGIRKKFVVIGSGQSAAEIFNDLWDRFPESDVTMLIRGSSLRPSDDSPFVNEIFDPERVDSIYAQESAERARAIAQDRATNYSVVRLTLLENIYEKLYHQRIKQSDESKHSRRIVTNRAVNRVSRTSDGGLVLMLRQSGLGAADPASAEIVQEIEADHVFFATGYLRNQHEEMLKDTVHLLPSRTAEKDDEGLFPVDRNYRIKYDSAQMSDECGVWLQGCNEKTHGLSDTLLSILAVRGGEMVESIFGKELSS